MPEQDISFLNKKNFYNDTPQKYDRGWVLENKEKLRGIICDGTLKDGKDVMDSWSSEVNEIHREPTKTGWIDVYERERVIATVKKVLKKHTGKLVVEFGSSEGYMIGEMKKSYPGHKYIATDLMADGLNFSYQRNPDIMHIQCDFTNAPFVDESVSFVFSLNVLEHMENDVGAIKECYRILKKGGVLPLCSA